MFEKVGAVAVEERRHLAVAPIRVFGEFGLVAAILKKQGLEVADDLRLVRLEVGDDLGEFRVEPRLRELEALAEEAQHEADGL